MTKTTILKRLALLFLIGVFLFLIGILIYLYAFKAPITSGKVIYHQPYKPGLSLDIYQPTQTTKEKSPVLLFFHGGAWIGAINTLRDSGYTVISATYTLARNGKSPFPDCIEDAFDVVKWVKKNWKVYNLDTNNVGVMGESAGGHIALMLGYARNDSFPQTALPLKFVVDVYGPTDLKALSQLAILDSMDTYLANVPSTISDRLDIVRYLVGFDPTSDSTRMFEFTQLYSPIQYVNPNIPPTLIVHGEKDQVVPIEQSILLHTVLDSLGLNNHFHKVNNMDHAFFGANTQQKQEVQQLIVDFVLKHQE